MYFKQSEKLKMLREQAKKEGLTFKKVDVNFCGVQAYGLFSRKTGVKVTNYINTLSNWFDAQYHNLVFSEYSEK